MKPLLLLWLMLAETLSTLPDNDNVERRGYFRVMTFNTWLSGASVFGGVEKIAKHVNRINPDVVMFQEIESGADFGNITQAMGVEKWKGNFRNGSYPDTGILTRHHYYANSYAQTDWAMGFKIRFNSTKTPLGYLNISVWSAHLQYQAFGPKAACNKLVKSSAVLMAGELNLGNDRPGRLQNIKEVLVNGNFRQTMKTSDKEPIVFAGDFNCPSHLDWTAPAKDLHCGWAFQWPVTKALTDANFTDSFRFLHPDPRKIPGTTWSTVQKFTGPDFGWTIPEPQERIDLVFWRGARLLPVASFVYFGDRPVAIKPRCKNNDWPSDHAAVVTDFAVID